MKVFYENTCGSWIVANDENEIKSVLSELYEIGNGNLEIQELDIVKDGFYVGKNIYKEDYSFNDMIGVFKKFSEFGNGIYDLKIRKSRYGFKIWESFRDILQKMDYGIACEIEEPFELFCAED